MRPVRRPVPVPAQRDRTAVRRLQDRILRVSGMQIVQLSVGRHLRDEHGRVYLSATGGRQKLRPVRTDDLRFRSDNRVRRVQVQLLRRGERKPSVRFVQRILRVIILFFFVLFTHNNNNNNKK